MQRRNEGDDVAVGNRVRLSATKLPIGVVDKHDNPWTAVNKQIII